MPLWLTVPASPDDLDPWPRAVPVQVSSAYAPVADAQSVAATSVVLHPHIEDIPDRRLRTLHNWSFSAGREATSAAAVSVPESWSRRDPGLADWPGPARYDRAVHSDAAWAQLVFRGLDYVAEILMDGERVAVHEGGFTPVAVDLPTGRDCAVSVVLDDPVETALLGADALLAPKRKIKGVHGQHDSRPGGMALGEQYDPTYVTRWPTGGLTGPVHVHEHGPLRLDAVFVTGVPGELRLNWVITSLDDAGPVELLAVVEGQTVLVSAELPAGAARVAVRLSAEGEQPWHPDAPHVYQVRAAVRRPGSPISDSAVVPLGFRRLELELAGERAMQLRLDGRRTYVRAANYIPGVWPAEVTPELVRRDIELALAAGLNSFGVHAGVVAPLPALADAAGLLIYQDFPLQWSYDPAGGPLVDGGPTFDVAARSLVAELAYDLYNHPSVVYWCGHNEPAYQLSEAFKTAQAPELASLAAQLDAYPDEEQTDVDRGRLLARVDPSRPVLAVSGLGASRPEGDTHDYAGSLSGGYAVDGRAGQVAFVSEYGAWSANPSAARRAPGACGDWPPPADVAADWHARTHLYATQCGYAGRPDRFPDFATWCFAGQLWAGWHAKAVTERARLAKWAPSAGQRYHFFVDHWGDGGAGVVDRFRTTGPAYRGLAAANRPLVALAPTPAGTVAPGSRLVMPITVVNDRLDAADVLQLRWRLAALGPDDAFIVGRDDPVELGPLQEVLAPRDHACVLPRRAGSVLLEGDVEVRIGPDSCAQVAEVAWDADVEGPVALFLDLGGAVSWTSLVVAPDGWSPVPGLTGPHRFRLTSDRPAPLRERWTGAETDPAQVPPGQYLLGESPVDVWDDVHVKVDGSVVTTSLPWGDPADPGSSRMPPRATPRPG